MINRKTHPILYNAFQESFILSKEPTYIKYLAKLVTLDGSIEGRSQDLIQVVLKDAENPEAPPLTKKLKEKILEVFEDIGSIGMNE